MPWHVARSDSCPTSRPWAVILDSDGSVEGCHPNRDAANRQMAALYANEGKSTMPTERFEHKRAFEVVEFKALDKKGEFEALVAVFGNVDLGGDRIVKTAFDKSLARWQEKGDPIPIIWNHMWDNPEAHIGEADPADVIATDEGLHVKRGRLDLDRPFAEQVHHLMSRRRVKEFSFGYNLLDKERTDDALDLLELDLFEFGPTLKGMNPETELLAVKALAAATEPQSPLVTVTASSSSTSGSWSTPVHSETHERTAPLVAAVKAGARHSRETLAALRRMRDEIDQLISVGETTDTPKSDEAEALGKASDPDADLLTRIRLLQEK